MTRRTDAHLSADDIDAWLAGHLGLTEQAHLAACPVCLEQAEADRALIQQLGRSTCSLRRRCSPTR